jgi:anti-sigma regulatory factor (Ser/Thr protein kinase)
MEHAPTLRDHARRASGPFGGAGRSNREGATMRVELDFGPTAAAEARAALSTLDGRVARSVLDDLRLLVSELVTNSVRHAGAGPRAKVGLEVVSRPRTVRVEVTDAGPGFEPRPRTEDQEKGSGWGLHLVAQIAERWGVDRSERTRVWFELEAS